MKVDHLGLGGFTSMLLQPILCLPNITIFNRENNYKWAIFYSFLYVYPRVT